LGFNWPTIRDLGYTIEDLKDSLFKKVNYDIIGMNVLLLVNLGFRWTDFSNAGYTYQNLFDSGLTNQQINDLGYSP
jgi:hypothetical protein